MRTVTRTREFNDIGEKTTITIQSRYEDLEISELPDRCLECPVGFMSHNDCGREYPLGKTRPKTCRLNLIDLDLEIKEKGNPTRTNHPVWKVLDREKYIEEFHPQAEAMYDFIKDMVYNCGTTVKDGNTVLKMKAFFDMWNEFSGETYSILGSLVNTEEQ